MAKGNRAPSGTTDRYTAVLAGRLITDIPHLYIFVVIRTLITDTPVSVCMRKVLWVFFFITTVPYSW